MLNLFYIDDENDLSIQRSFHRIATELMNNYKLKFAESFYRIVECEFYYYSNRHPDPFVHGHSRQKQTQGEWYFHGSGLDITLGSNRGYGGILLRGIAAVKKEYPVPRREDAIIGPLKICSELFTQLGSVELSSKTEIGFVDITREKMGASMPEATVFAVPRIGLNAKNEHAENFISRPYRFLSYLHLPHKYQEKVKSFLTSGASATLTVEAYNKHYFFRHDS